MPGEADNQGGLYAQLAWNLKNDETWKRLMWNEKIWKIEDILFTSKFKYGDFAGILRSGTGLVCTRSKESLAVATSAGCGLLVMSLPKVTDPVSPLCFFLLFFAYCFCLLTQGAGHNIPPLLDINEHVTRFICNIPPLLVAKAFWAHKQTASCRVNWFCTMMIGD